MSSCERKTDAGSSFSGTSRSDFQQVIVPDFYAFELVQANSEADAVRFFKSMDRDSTRSIYHSVTANISNSREAASR